MKTADAQQAAFRLGEWCVEPCRNVIHRDGEVRQLRRLTMEVLLQLAGEAPAVVSTERLINAHWPHEGVGDHGLKTVVSELRKALGDDARHPSYIETIPKRGYRLIAPIDVVDDAGTGADSPRPGGRRLTTLAIGMAALVGLLVLAAVPLWRESERSVDDSAPVRLFLEPFRVDGDAGGAIEFQPGLQEELLNALSRISRIRLLPLGSTEHEPAADDYVLSGSIRRLGNGGVRLVVRLARSDRVLWSSAYAVALEEPIAIQLDAATKVTRAMNRLANAQSWLNRESTEEASLALLRASLALDDTNDGLKTAMAYADEALELDPAFARAMVFKAGIYRGAANWFLMDINDAVAAMQPLVRGALMANPRLGVAWALDAQLKLYEGDFEAAEASIRNAERYALANELRMVAGYYTFCGRFDEALKLLARHVQADPIDPLVRRFQGQTLHYAGHYRQAIDVFDEILSVMPFDERARHLKGSVLESMGEFERAAALEPWFGLVKHGWADGGSRGIAQAFLEFAEDTEQGRTQFPPGSAWRIYTWAYARLGQPLEAVRWMERGWRAGDRWEFLYLRVYDWPGFARLRAHPAFQELMSRTIGSPPTCPGSHRSDPTPRDA